MTRFDAQRLPFPSPPLVVGAQALFHAICAILFGRKVPPKKKLILFIFQDSLTYTHLGALNKEKKYVSKAPSIELMSVSLPHKKQKY